MCDYERKRRLGLTLSLIIRKNTVEGCSFAKARHCSSKRYIVSLEPTPSKLCSCAWLVFSLAPCIAPQLSDAFRLQTWTWTIYIGLSPRALGSITLHQRRTGMIALGKKCLHVRNSTLCCKACVCAWLAKVEVYLLLQTTSMLSRSLDYRELIAKQGGPGIYTCNFGTWRHEI